MINLTDYNFKYEPYPYVILKNILNHEFYKKIIAEFPDNKEFYKSDYGKSKAIGKFNKFQLDNFYSPNFNQVINKKENIKKLYTFLNSENFINIINNFLKENYVDLAIKMQKNFIKKILTKKKYKVYFELSSIPCDNGFIAAHTDSPQKIITCVMPIVDEGCEVSELENVGTTILNTDNIKYKYNFQNITVPQDQTKKIDYVDFLPNQMMLFVKTHNSLHSVGPIITKEKKDLFRKSINICIVKQF